MAVRPPRGSEFTGWARRLAGRPQPEAGPQQAAVSLAPARSRWEPSGRVRSVSLRDRSENVSAMVVELELDPSSVRAPADSPAFAPLGPDAALMLVWLGRRGIPGIAPGAHLRVHGLVTMVRTRPTMFNPGYELLISEDAR